MTPQEIKAVKRLKRFREIVSLYTELLYAVEKKFPNETRHETALRYIREREALSQGSNPVQKEDKP